MKIFYQLFCLLLFPLFSNAQITVTSTADSGFGSLRQAIIDANADPALDNIFFNINGGGAQTIFISSQLPFITDDGITINATTQPGYSNSPLITLNGNGGAGSAIVISGADNCSVSGLKVTNFELYGLDANICQNTSVRDNVFTENRTINLVFTDADNGLVQGNLFNINSNMTSSPTGRTGIFMQGGSESNNITNNTIGAGLNNTDFNLIVLLESGTDGNTIDDNFIGTGAGGQDYGNPSRAGILISDASSTRVSGNTIAFNLIGIQNVGTASENSFSANNFFCNQNFGIVNDPGANNNIQPPSITQATTDAITGTANPNHRVQFYLQDNSDCPGTACQGEFFASVTADAFGDWTFFPGRPVGSVISVIQLGPVSSAHTSAFSECVTLVAGCDLDTEGPVISGIPMDITIGCDDSYPNVSVLFANITAFDNFDGDVTGEIFEIPPGFVVGCVPGPSRDEEYLFTVTDFCGNNTTESFIITIFNDVSVDLGQDRAICNNNPITLDAGNPSLSYEWSTGEITQTIEVNSAGTYSVTVTGNNQCCDIDEIIISTGTPPDVTAMGTTIDCGPGPFFVTASSTTPGVTYLWTDEAGNTSTNQNTEVLGGGGTMSMGMITLVVTAPNGCTTTTSVTVIEDTTPPDVTAMGTTIGCGPGPFFVTASSTTPGVTYLWTDEAGNTSTNQNTEVLGGGGTMSMGMITLVVTAPNGCTTTTSVTVTEDTTPPDVTAMGTTIGCGPGPFFVTASSTTSGVTYLWTDEDGNTSTNQNTEVLGGGTMSMGMITLVVTAPNGCSTTTSVTVTEDTTPPDVTATGGTITCMNPSITLMANSTTPGVTYLWSGPFGTTPGQNLITSTAGEYGVRATAPNGCTFMTSVIVLDETTDMVAPIFSGIPMNVTIGCDDPYPDTDALFANITAFDAVDGDLTGEITVIPPGFVVGCVPGPTRAEEYFFIVSDACDNETIETFVITILNDVSVDLGPDKALCDNEAITLDAGNPGLDYEWSTGASTQTIDVNFAGTYSVTVTGGNLCCDTDEIVITTGTPPSITATGGTVDCGNNPLTLTANSTTPGVTYLWTDSNGETTTEQNPSVSSGGIVTVMVTAPSGCTASTTVTVIDERTDTEGPVFSGIPVDISIGCDDPYPDTDALFANITAFDNVDGDLTDVIFQILPGFVVGCVPGPSRAEEYIFSVTDACGTTTTETFTITILNDLSVDLGFDLEVCNIETITLDAGNPGLTYEWSTGETTQTIEVSFVGTYSVTVTGGNLCCAVDEIIISTGTPPDVTAMGTTIDCGPGPFFVTASSTTPGVTYLWTDEAGNTSTNQNTEVLGGGGTMSMGMITLVVTAPNGCTTTTSVTVIEDTTPPDVTAMGITIGCGPGPFFVTASSTTPGVTYFWTDENGVTSTEQNPEVFGDGASMNTSTITLVVTAPNGCSTTTSVTVIEDTTTPEVTATGTTIGCGPGPFFVTASSTTPGVTYFWTDENGVTSTEQNPEVFGDGGTMNTTTITLVVTAPNGCSTTTMVTVIEDTTPPDVTAMGTTIGCGPGPFFITASSSTPGVTYFWTDENGVTSTEQNPEVFGDGGTMNTTTITLVVTAPNGCSTTTSVTVIEDTTPPDVTATGTTIDCRPGPFFITASSTTPGVIYFWTDENGVTSTEQNPEVFGDGGTMNTTTITLVVTAPNGCSTTTSVTVIEDTTPPDVTATGGTITCITTSVTLMANSTTPGVTYLWTDPNGLTSSEQNPTDISLAGTYTVVVTASNSCTAMTTVTVIDDTTPPDITATGGTINCINSSVTLMANSTTPGVTYLWTDPNGTNTTEQNPADIILVGTYTVVATAPNGCTATATVMVIEDITPPDVTATGGTITCANPFITLMASSVITGVTYRWTYPNGLNSTEQNPLAFLLGTYIVEVTAPSGCIAMTTVTVIDGTEVAPMSSFTFSDNELMVSFMDNSTNMPTSWFWNFGDGNTATDQSPTYNYLAPGTYTVCLTARNDCGENTTCETVSVTTSATDVLTFSVGSATGQSGTIIQIPVSVQYFTNIVSFQKSIHVADPTAARLVGVSDFNLAGLDITDFNLASGDTLTVAWFNEGGVSVPDGTVIYMLNIELLTSFEECTSVFIDGNPTIIEAADLDVDGSISAVPYLIKSGEACVLPKVDILGSIFRENGVVLEDVIVECTTAPATITDAFGEYEFLNLGSGLDYTVIPTRNTDHRDGVTAIDLALIQRHILNVQLLNSPYKMIAADVDISGLVSGIDLVKMQQLILNITTEFPDFNSWRFVDEKFLFTDPANPFLDNFPEDIEFMNLGQDTFGNDFIAMKLGDVNESAIGLQAPDGGEMNMLIAETVNSDGSRVIEFRSAENTTLSAYQFDIQFDYSQMSLLEVIPGALPGLNSTFFGMDNVEEGLITTLWYDPSATEGGWELEQDEVLFSLRFEAPAVVAAIEDRIQAGVATMKSAGYKHNGDALKIKTNYQSLATGVEGLSSDQLISQLSVFPNPFQDKASISFTLATASTINVQVYDATGKVVKTIQQYLGAGAQQISISANDLNGIGGLYLVKLQTGDYVVTRKIMFQK